MKNTLGGKRVYVLYCNRNKEIKRRAEAELFKQISKQALVLKNNSTNL